MLFLNVRKLKSVSFLFVFFLQENAEDEGKDSEACEYYHRNQISSCRLAQVADEHRHKAEPYVLHPEDEALGTAENLLVNNLRH